MESILAKAAIVLVVFIIQLSVIELFKLFVGTKAEIKKLKNAERICLTICAIADVMMFFALVANFY